MARGVGTQSSVTEQKAAEQLGFRDEQDLFIMAPHFPELLVGSVHVHEPLFGRGGEGKRNGSLRSMGHQTCRSQGRGS